MLEINMKLLKSQNIQLKKYKYIFRESHITHLFRSIFIFLLISVSIFLFNKVAFPLYVTIISSGLLGLFALLQFNAFIKTLLSSNWLLAIDNEGILLKLRSYLHTLYPKDGMQIVFIPFNEISSARITKKEITYPDIPPTGATVEKNNYLDITVISENLKELQNQLKCERNIRIKGKTHYNHYPVSIIDNKIIRIEWNTITSGINSAIKVLNRYVSRETDIYEKEDFTNFETLQKKDLKDKILELVKQGKTLAAIKIVMKAYNWNTTQATEFVKKLLEE